MTSESSPFRPGQPVPAELFVGRLDAIERLRGLVRSADRGVFKIGFITGERGIGKSSLASFVRRLCEQDSGVTGCHVYLGGAHDLHEMARHVFDRLLKDSIDRPWRRQVLELFGDRVRKTGLFGVSVELDGSRGRARLHPVEPPAPADRIDGRRRSASARGHTSMPSWCSRRSPPYSRKHRAGG